MEAGGPVEQYLLKTLECDNQFCGSGMFIRIRIFSIPDPGSEFLPSRIHIKEFKYFSPNSLAQIALENMIQVVHPGSGSWFFTHPGSRGQKLKGTGSRILLRTLVTIIWYLRTYTSAFPPQENNLGREEASNRHYGRKSFTDTLRLSFRRKYFASSSIKLFLWTCSSCGAPWRPCARSWRTSAAPSPGSRPARACALKSHKNEVGGGGERSEGQQDNLTGKAKKKIF